MNRYKKLIKNTALITVGNFASKLLTFFLLPLYTAILTTAEYGVADLIDSVKKRFNKSLHSCCSPFLVLSFDVSATGTAGCRIGSQATLSP